MPWERILRAVEEMAGVPGPESERWSPTLDSLRTCGLFRDVDVRIGTSSGIVLLTLDPALDLEEFATAVSRLGPPDDVSIVSPPIRTPGGARPDWDRKHSVGHVLGGRLVWFGLETVDEVETLRSIAIHYDATERLPPVGEEGLAHFTMSLGWCGGHGEAVLDEDRHVRVIDGLPVFLDDDGRQRILGSIDLGGSYSGTPVVRVSGRVRLEPRSERNSSIPGAPRQKFLALVVTSLEEARVVGEPADGGP